MDVLFALAVLALGAVLSIRAALRASAVINALVERFNREHPARES